MKKFKILTLALSLSLGLLLLTSCYGVNSHDKEQHSTMQIVPVEQVGSLAGKFKILTTFCMNESWNCPAQAVKILKFLTSLGR